MAAGSFKLWPLDKDGKLLDYPEAGPEPPPPKAGEPPEDAKLPAADNLVAPDPSNPKAVDIYFGVRSDLAEAPPKEQGDLLDKIQKVLRTVQILYPATETASERNLRQFRSYYVRLYRLGQLGLEGKNVSPDIATAALETTTADLIDDEAGNVKRTHLRILGARAAIGGAGCLALYLLLRLISAYWAGINDFLVKMGVQPCLLSNFMLLLAGCFLGVWLSYGIRTTAFTLSDLTVTDADRLTPVIRLIFAGSLTVILGIIFTVPLVKVELGQISVTDITKWPMLAFVVGCFCGVSELALPAAVAKRAGDFIQNIK